MCRVQTPVLRARARACVCFYVCVSEWGLAQLVERRTVTPRRQVRFPIAARDFFPRVNFQCRLSYGVLTPPCAIANTTSVRTLKILQSIQSSVEYENTKAPSMHRRLGSTTLSQLAFRGESNPNFPWEKSEWENTVVNFFFFFKSKKKKVIVAPAIGGCFCVFCALEAPRLLVECCC